MSYVDVGTRERYNKTNASQFITVKTFIAEEYATSMVYTEALIQIPYLMTFISLYLVSLRSALSVVQLYKSVDGWVLDEIRLWSAWCCRPNFG